MQSLLNRISLILLVFSVQQNMSASMLPNIVSRDRCITKDELIKIQKNTLEGNISYFEKIKWDYLESSSVNYYDYFDDEIDWEYEAVAWEIRDDDYIRFSGIQHRSVFQRIYYMYAPGKPSIVVLDPVIDDGHLWYGTSTYDGEECFKNLKSRCGKSQTNPGKYEFNKCSEQSVTIECRDYFSSGLIVIVYNESGLLKEVSRIEAIKAEKERLDQIRSQKIESLISQGDSLFDINRYAEAKNRFIEANDMEPSSLVSSKIDACHKAITGIIKTSADSLFQLHEYANAKTKYQEAISFNSTSQFSFDTKMSETLKQCMIECDYIPAVNRAVDFLNNKNYAAALKEYENANKLKPTEENVISQIDLIKKTMNFLDHRATEIYPYSKFNNTDYTELQNSILKSLNENISSSSNGNLSCEIVVSFDTSGKNISRIDNYSSTIDSEVFKRVLNNSKLRPIEFYGYYAHAKDAIALNGSWASINSSHRFEHNQLVSYKSSKKEYLDFYEDFAYQNSIRQGTFKSTLKIIEFNKKLHSEIEVIGYKPIGPANALYSVLFPCWGTYKINSVDKAISRWYVMGTAAGGAVLLEYFSRYYYNTYKSSTDQSTRDYNFKIADGLHKLSLISFGVIGAVYIYDIIDVFHHGIKNIKEGKPLQKRLKNGPIKIKKDPINTL